MSRPENRETLMSLADQLLWGMQQYAHDTRTSTLVVAASNSLDPTLAPDAYQCSGVNDEVEMNAALVAAAAVNGSVELLEGDYNTVLTLSVAVNVTLKAVGWGAVINFDAGGNAITISGNNVKIRDLKIVIAVGAGGAGTRPNGVSADTFDNIEVSGLWLVGDTTVGYDGSENRQNGIFLSSVSNTVIIGNFSESWSMGINLYSTFGAAVSANNCRENMRHGIYLDSMGFGSCVGNYSTENLYHGIVVESSYEIAVVGNTCYLNERNGITITYSNYCPVTSNNCTENTWNGIAVDTYDENIIMGNTAEINYRHGIYLLDTDGNLIVGNICNDNDYDFTSTYDGINIDGDSDNNLVHSNVCNGNGRYGIGILAATCDKNWVKNNLLRANDTAPFNDAGTDTKLAVKAFTFTEAFGGDAAWKTTSPTGIQIDATGETALAVGEAPLEVQMAVRFRVKGVALGATGVGKGMLLEININAGKPTNSDPYNAEAIAVASVISTEDDVALNDAIEWIIDATDDVDVDDIEFGETMEMFAVFEDTGADSDIATNAAIRTISMEYV